MNLPNKITISRIVLTIIINILLLFPFESAGINFTNLFVNELIVVNVKYLIVGVLFVLAVITDIIDCKIARKRDMVTPFGMTLDTVADKMLTDSVLIILSSQGFIHPIITIVIVLRDIVVNALKSTAISNGKKLLPVKTGKVKAMFLNLGIALTLFYNLPFELYNIKVSDILLIIGTVLAVVSCIQYHNDNIKAFNSK